MQEVKIGIVGLGNVGIGALSILSENAAQIAAKLGFRLNVVAVCSRTAKSKMLPVGFSSALVTENWREVVSLPGIEIVAELIGGTGVAREVVEGAIANGKSVVTANKELIALDGVNIWRQAAAQGVALAMEILLLASSHVLSHRHLMLTLILISFSPYCTITPFIMTLQCALEYVL